MRASKTLCLTVVMALLFPFAMTGCGNKKAESEAAADPAASSSDPAAAGAAESLDTPESQQQAGDISEGRTSGPMLPVYFEFDSSSIQEGQVERIEHNGDYLKTNQNVKVRIEGNCDQRGSNEYNLALGQRRAEAALKYLVNLGIDKNRLSTVSWGEEKPLVFGQDETSWAQNRRDDFVLAE